MLLVSDLLCVTSLRDVEGQYVMQLFDWHRNPRVRSSLGPVQRPVQTRRAPRGRAGYCEPSPGRLRDCAAAREGRSRFRGRNR